MLHLQRINGFVLLNLLSFFLPPKEDEVMPAKFEEDLIWVAAGAPLSDSTFLSNKIKDLCGDLPIFWLRPTYSTSKYCRWETQAPYNLV